MKRMKWLISGLVVLTILCFFVVPKVSAQAWDGKWVRLSCVVKAYEVNPGTGAFEKHNTKFTAYLGFTDLGPGVAGGLRRYALAVWTETAPGTWTSSTPTPEDTVPANENFFSDIQLYFQLGGGEGIPPYILVNITPAIIQSRRNLSFVAEGEVVYGIIDLHQIYGGITIKGVSVDPSKLPFTP